MSTDTEQKLIAKIKVLHDTVWEGRASQPVVDEWLSNFNLGTDNERERLHGLFLLSQFMYFGSRQMRALLRAMYRDLFRYPIVESIRKSNSDTTDLDFINARFHEVLHNTRFLGIGNPSESGAHLLYFYRQENGLPKTQFIHAHQVLRRHGEKVELRDPKVDRLVFIDDFCGSGSQGIEYSEGILEEFKSLQPNLQVAYHVLFATAKGLQILRNDTLFDSVECIFELDASFTCFGSESRYFSRVDEAIDKAFAESFCRTYGQRLCQDDPLGFDDCQLLIGFHHNTPDNTLPIFWFDEPTEPNWLPIFKRYPKNYGWAQQ